MINIGRGPNKGACGWRWPSINSDKLTLQLQCMHACIMHPLVLVKYNFLCVKVGTHYSLTCPNCLTMCVCGFLWSCWCLVLNLLVSWLTDSLGTKCTWFLWNHHNPYFQLTHTPPLLKNPTWLITNNTKFMAFCNKAILTCLNPKP